MSDLKWLPEALADLERLHGFLYDKNPPAAGRALAAILAGLNLLKQSPRLGRPMPDETGRREFLIPFASGAYVLRYKTEGENVAVILRVWHSKEDRSIK